MAKFQGFQCGDREIYGIDASALARMRRKAHRGEELTAEEWSELEKYLEELIEVIRRS